MLQRNAPQGNLKILLNTSVSSDAGLSLYISVQYNVLYNLVFLLSGDFPASEFYVPTFWNTLSVPSS